ncbi:MAG: glucosaminidase domain-containing protein [Gammaproteobacteria bacterium]|nr:glucosaminidase domain-containing protein [Gammaproteobacteria bacterium]
MVKQLKISVLTLVVLYSAIYPFISKDNSKDVQSSSSETVTSANVDVPEEASFGSEVLPDFSKYQDVKQKKRAFFGYLAPLVRQINSEMLSYRKFVLSVKNPPKDAKTTAKFEKVANKFHIDLDQDFASIRQQMLLRIDAIPVELVLMQAANESAWGTSRFALVANNLFGQWCFKPGCGVVPTGRPDGEKYEVRKFEHPINSIRSYFNNLNTGHAYDDMREIRLALREDDKPLNASEIAEGLLSYSIRREAYIEEIQAMIRINSKYIPKANG